MSPTAAHPARICRVPGRPRGFAAVVVSAALALTLAGTPRASAADPDAQKRAVDSQLSQLRVELHDTEGDLGAAYLALRETEAKLPGAQAALTAAEDQLRSARAADAQAAADLQLAQANEKKAEDQLAATSAEILLGRGRVAAFAGQVYMEQGMGSLNAAVDADSPQQLADRLALVGAVMDTQHSALTRLATAKASQTAQEAHVTALRADSEAAKAKAEEAVRATEAARAQAAAAKADLDKLAADQKAHSAAVQARLDGQRQREAEMQAESNRLAEVIRKAAEEARRRAAEEAARGAAQQRANALMAWPLPGGVVTSEFGYRIHPITHARTLHAGLDIATPCGQPIVAAMDGQILSAGWGGGYGNRVVIDHGIQRGVPVATSYNHMQSIRVSGGTVRKGQVIGYEGSTGFSTGCHLHFEVYVDGNPSNPRPWL